ncbi:hypothetical protein HPP92_005581 [Vanilla planifolia]|uniref:RRM domain-containing protein n=1 Tax=Vanilla planifolia TaxID=51239 RepID=A0A835RU60_VANPL|nr:hypothetical protein HPP92_005581 [Vanilla planifolia]
MHLMDKALSGSLDLRKRVDSKEPEEKDDGPWLNLWVGNISPETVDEDLIAVFGKYGAIDCITSCSPRSHAFVYFRTAENAKAARDALQGTVLRGKAIRVEFARPARPGRTLWVGGISQSVTKDQLEDEFMKFGKIEEYQFLRHRGSAFISFFKVRDAVVAQKSMNWKKLGGVEIRVDFQKFPDTRKNEQGWQGEFDYTGSRNLLRADPLFSPDQMQCIQGSPLQGLNKQLAYGGTRNDQPSNVLWVVYPLDLQIDEELLHNSMILFGEIERIKSFPSRKYCFVEFRSVDEARRAKEGLQGQGTFFNESNIGPVEVFGTGHALAPKGLPGRLALNSIPRNNMLMVPFTQAVDHPQHIEPNFQDISGGFPSFPEGISNSSITANWKRLSPSTPGVISSGPVIRPPFRASPVGRDELGVRESKRSRLDGAFPHNNEVRFQEAVDDDLLELPGLPHQGKIIPFHNRPAPDIRDHGPSRASPGADYCWRGIIAKGGTPVCHARCLPIGHGIEAPFPEIVNCSARTGLDMLTTHYAEAIGFDMVYFLPDSEDDFASYTEFLRYLGQRDRAGVSKFDDGTTMFLVPPSDFLKKVLKFSGPDRLYGVVLKFPQQTATRQPVQAAVALADPIDPLQGHPLQKNYDLTGQNDEKSLVLGYGSSLLERTSTHAMVGQPRLVHSEEPYAVPSITQDHPKSHGNTSKVEVTLTPELIASLASLIPKSNISAALSTQISSSSSVMPVSFSGPHTNDTSMLVQGWGQEARTSFSGTSVEQMYNPMHNLTPPGNHYTNQPHCTILFQPILTSQMFWIAHINLPMLTDKYKKHL